MKLFKVMVAFFVLTIISGAAACCLQYSNAYEASTIFIFIALASLFVSFILSFVTAIIYKVHRTVTIFILVITSLGLLSFVYFIMFIFSFGP